MKQADDVSAAVPIKVAVAGHLRVLGMGCRVARLTEIEIDAERSGCIIGGLDQMAALGGAIGL